MMLLKRLLDFYINSSLHVALAVLSFCVLTTYELDLNSSIVLFSAVFCAAIVGYNFVKYFGLAKFYYRSLTTKLKYIQLVSALSILGLGYAFLQLQSATQMLLFFLGLITFFYAIPMGLKTPKNLRSIGGVKIYIIAFVWAMTTVALPILESQLLLNFEHWILIVQRTFIIIVLMLPFEIRDLDLDQIYLSTIPQKIGVRNTKIIGYALLGFVNRGGRYTQDSSHYANESISLDLALVANYTNHATKLRAMDVWEGTDLGVFSGGDSFTTPQSVPPHGAVLVRFAPESS